MPSFGNTEETIELFSCQFKGKMVDTSPEPSDNETAALASHDDLKDDVGGLSFDQYAAGGLGRHLGVFSTTSLM